MQTASNQMFEQFEHSLSIIRHASVDVLQLLKIYVAEGKDPRWFLEQLEQARLNLGGWTNVAKRLHLNDAEMSEFTLQLRHLQQTVPQYERGQNVHENQRIAALRFLSTLEAVKAKQPRLRYDTKVGEAGEDLQIQAQRQLRALELTIKALVSQAWPDTLQLTNHLKLQFGADNVRRWLTLGNSGDILSGMMFSELALLLVDKKEFARHYSTIFHSATSLSYLVDPRITLQAFLEHCRQLRNAVISGRPLSSAELALLDSYSQQIAGPVQRAFEQKKTGVNPSTYMIVEDAALKEFWEQAIERDKEAGGDTTSVSDNIEGHGRHAKRTPEEREQLISGVLLGAVGVMVLAILGGAIWIFSSEVAQRPIPRVPTAEALASTELEEQSPRERLSSLGITWDAFSLHSAIDRNDVKVAQLFLQGGMNWELSWTEQAMDIKNDEVLELLLRYRMLMDEPKPCRRFINNISHLMANGQKLTMMRKSYLQTFCSRPPVIARQYHELELAQQRMLSQPNELNKKWLDIQQAIYDQIR